jgi:hypothetical protein
MKFISYITDGLAHIEHPKGTMAAGAASAASCFTGFDLHSALGYIGQIVGILSGLASFGWLAYQFYRSTHPKQ